jgi:hypothetical protein
MRGGLVLAVMRDAGNSTLYRCCLRYIVRDGWADGWHSVEQPEAWTFGHAVLQSETISVEAKLFAASTLKGKVCEHSMGWPRGSIRLLTKILDHL